MNFFEYQDKARQSTSTLVALFALSLLLITVVIYFIIMAIFIVSEQGENLTTHAVRSEWWNPQVFTIATSGTLLMVGLGSIFKIATLRHGGGRSVALLLGGRLAQRTSKDLKERRLINVVEEMSIASGVAVPEIYILDQELGINAFAAGFTPDDAVVAVTKGTLELLNRDELQGVIAHEFSHILNGDMRLNINLMGVLHGILVIAYAGYWIMRLTAGSGRSNRKGSSGQIVILGFALLVVGGVGLFFGRLIKAAVSRQREFLADASAVQFTRNPSGIAGALTKIGGFTQGSRISAPAAEEASHLFFGNGIGQNLFSDGALSTHPPLAQRILRIDPHFSGEFPVVQSGSLQASGAHGSELKPALTPEQLKKARSQASGFQGGVGGNTPAEQVTAQIGTPNTRQISHSAALLQSIPTRITNSIDELIGSVALTYALLLDENKSLRTTQLNFIPQGPLRKETKTLYKALEGIGRELRLPLLDLSAPTLKGLSRKQYQKFRHTIESLIFADKQVTPYEISIKKVLQRRLDSNFSLAGRKVTQYYSLGALMKECRILISALAHASTTDKQESNVTFLSAMEPLPQLKKGQQQILGKSDYSTSDLEGALDKLALATPAIKKRVFEAAVRCVFLDNKATSSEAHLLRTIAAALECPLPAFFHIENEAPHAAQG